MATPSQPISAALDQVQGTLRLAPTWVPRSFCVPGRRIKLHPDDYYAVGGDRGGIDERWLASTVAADNGPLTGPEEGLSIVVDGAGNRVGTLAEAVAELGERLGVQRPWGKTGGGHLSATFLPTWFSLCARYPNFCSYGRLRASRLSSISLSLVEICESCSARTRRTF